MLDALVWFFQQILLGFVNFFAAIINVQSWLDWSNGEAIVRFVYYGASVEFFFVIFNTIVVLTLIGIWRPGFMWGGVRVLEGTANTVGRVAAWAGLLMVLQQIVVVFVQRIFAVSQISIGLGTAVTFDVSWWSEGLKLYNAMLVSLCVAYTFVQGGHVRVDILYASVSFRTKKIIDMVGAVVFMMPMSLLIWHFGWFFLWRHLILPAPSASDGLDRLIQRAQILRWNVETTGFSPQGFSAYFLFKILLVAFAALVFMQAVAMLWRSIAELREGEASEGKNVDRDVLGDPSEEKQHEIHSGAT